MPANVQTQTDPIARPWPDLPLKQPILLHPVVFVALFTLFGSMFALQEWVHLNSSGYHIDAFTVFEAWGLQYFLWGVTAWILWRLFRTFIYTASVVQILTIVLPVSFITCLIEEMIWVVFFPNYLMGHTRSTYWHRVMLNFKGDLSESMSIFWGAFFFIRGVGYYQRLQEKETIAAQLEIELANAKIATLRMQLNPHFLFNTMNSISSLMRSNIEAADSLLEQLSSLLRMTLERRDVQLIPLHEEIEFTETYLQMQDVRYEGRVDRTLAVDPNLHDAMVPAMILLPIIENAYVHGLSKLGCGGSLSVEVRRRGEKEIEALVTNSGLGLNSSAEPHTEGHGVGLTNVRNRLRLHYGERGMFSMRELAPDLVQVSITFPLQLSVSAAEGLTRFGD